MGRAISSATQHPPGRTHRGHLHRGGAQLRTGVRNKFRGTLRRSGMSGERGGNIMRIASASRGARGRGADCDGLDK
eukprot:2522958-Pyramimonas_sp.AAC.1